MSVLEPPRARRGPFCPSERDGHLVLQGEVEWLVEGPEAVIEQMAMQLRGPCERIGSNLAALSFGNAVGFFDVPGYGLVEVVSSKWSDADFDRMLEELTGIATALPFAGYDSGVLPYDRNVLNDRDVPYHAFTYLRRVLSDAPRSDERLLQALEAVVREPHRFFESVRTVRPLELVNRVDERSLVDIASARTALSSAEPISPEVWSLARNLRGYLPLEVSQREVFSSLDTAENRFVKSFLAFCSGVIEHVRQWASTAQPTAFTNRLGADCTVMKRRLEPIVRHSMWLDVGDMVHIPANSPVLQRRRGYRDVFRHYTKMRLASRISGLHTLLDNLLEVRDIAQLYELWCFFCVVDAVERVLGRPESAAVLRYDTTQAVLPADIEVSWVNGTKLVYNPTFSRSRPLARRSYSVPLRPDIGLWVTSGPNQGLHLLDAKFRLTKLDVLLSDAAVDDADTVDTEERIGTFKRGDLYKMHTYRDAIPEAHSVTILYPGEELRFFSRNGAVARSAEELPALYSGVGALPLQPTDSVRRELTRFIESVLAV